jgi:hypothetical protein
MQQLCLSQLNRGVSPPQLTKDESENYARVVMANRFYFSHGMLDLYSTSGYLSVKMKIKNFISL